MKHSGVKIVGGGAVEVIFSSTVFMMLDYDNQYLRGDDTDLAIEKIEGSRSRKFGKEDCYIVRFVAGDIHIVDAIVVDLETQLHIEYYGGERDPLWLSTLRKNLKRFRFVKRYLEGNKQ